jgi:large subunit ribosomal protein L27
MSHVKAGGSSKNIHNNAGHRLGVKRFGGQTVNAGEVLVRQTGSTKIAGPGTYISKNFTIHAANDGVVSFAKVRKGHFTGKTVPRTQVSVIAE